MKFLLDTNILLRLSHSAHPHYPAAIGSLRYLAAAGHTFCIGSQTISEFLAVATRSIADRGLGMDHATADRELSKVSSVLEVIYDSKEVIEELRQVVVRYSVTGKSVHDAKLVAAMTLGGIKDILTFNVRDFTRYAGISVHNPELVVSPAAGPAK